MVRIIITLTVHFSTLSQVIFTEMSMNYLVTPLEGCQIEFRYILISRTADKFFTSLFTALNKAYSSYNNKKFNMSFSIGPINKTINETNYWIDK